MSLKANSSHDISFLKQDGTTEIGLMLARDKNGVPQYGEFDDPALAQQFFSGEPGYANLPPEKEIQIGQDDWRSGVGQEIYDTSDTKRYWKSVNMDLRFKGQAMCGPLAATATIPTGVVRAYAEFNDKLYIGVDTKLCVLNDDGDEFTEVEDFEGTKNITDLEAFTDDYLYIALGKANKYYRMNTDEGFFESGQADGKADFLQTVDTTLWKACKPREMKSATAPETSWTSRTDVGSTAEDILGIFEESGQLFVRKEDMPYYFDTSAVIHRLIPATKSMQADTTGDNAGDVWGAKVYFPYGAQGLVEYNTVTGVQTWRSPSKRCTNLTEYIGKVQAVTHDEEWLFVIVDNDDKVELLACRLEDIDGTDTWVVHPLAQLTLTGCQIAFVSTVYKKRIYIANTASGTSLAYYPLPTKYGDIDEDSDYTFQTDGYFITPWHHANFKGDCKAYIKLTLTMADADDDKYFEAHYRIKGVTGWTDIGDFKSTPSTTQYIPVTGSGINPTGVMIQFKFVAITNDTSTTPKLLNYDCRGIWYPTKRKIIACRVKCADGLTLKSGGIDSQTASTIKEAIEEARDDATWPVTFYDIGGSTIYVKFLGANYQMAEVGKERNKEYVFDLMLSKVTLSETRTGKSFDAYWDFFIWG